MLDIDQVLDLIRIPEEYNINVVNQVGPYLLLYNMFNPTDLYASITNIASGTEDSLKHLPYSYAAFLDRTSHPRGYKLLKKPDGIIFDYNNYNDKSTIVPDAREKGILAQQIAHMSLLWDKTIRPWFTSIEKNDTLNQVFKPDSVLQLSRISTPLSPTSQLHSPKTTSHSTW